MDKTTQDLAWSCLPKEFKKEVKAHYAGLNAAYKAYLSKDSLSNEECDRCNVLREKMALYQMYFGIDNLTSDAEGDDEMLTVSRKQIDALQGEIFKAIMDAHDADDWQDAAHYILDVMPRSFAALFGSKCLPDELNEDNFATKKPQPAEPKNEGTHQEQCVPQNAESGTHSFNHILKDSFRKERRLNIAAQIVASMIGSDDWTTWRGGSNKEIWHNMAKSSLEIADALIAEAEKGGGNA